MNNKGLLGLNIALLIAVVVLFIMQFSGKSTPEVANIEETVETSKEQQETGVDTSKITFESLPQFESSMKIAYVNNDSLLANYLYMEDLSKELNDKILKEQSKLQSKAASFQQRAIAFNEEAQKGIMSEDEYLRRGGELQKEEQRLYQEEQDVQQKLANINYELQLKLIDHTDSFFKKLGTELGYDYVVTYQKGVNIFMYANPKYDITEYVIEKLNEDYNRNAPQKEAK